MKKKWSEKAKKNAVVAGLAVVGILAVSGISFFIYKDTPQKVELAEREETVDTVNIPEENLSVLTEEDTVTTDTDEIVVFTGIAEIPETENTYEQFLQPTPVKTEDQKPAEASGETATDEAKVNKTGNTDKPAAQPSNKQSSHENADTPKHGDIQGDKIYIDGFGWVDYNGGETVEIQADDIYENGNKIGIMD